MEFDFLNFIKQIIFWLSTKGLKILFILLASWFVNFFVQKIVKVTITKGIKDGLGEERKKRIETLVGAFGGTLKFIIWIVVILIVISEFGVNIAPLLASLGIASFALGMAAKDTISDFISGFFILLEGQYKVGDKVKIGNVEGEVVEFNLRRTIIKDESGFLHFFPNSQIRIVARKIQ